MLSSLMNGMTGGYEDLGGAGYLGEWNPYLGEYVGGATADWQPTSPQ